MTDLSSLNSPQVMWWLGYITLRSRLAREAYTSAFDERGGFRSKSMRPTIKDIHAFFTHAAMVARVFIPSKNAPVRTRERAEALKQRIGPRLEPLQSCLRARNDLDHFDERMDGVLEYPDGLFSEVTIIAETRQSLAEMLNERRILPMFAYVAKERAIVTWSREDQQAITPLLPIREELEYVAGWHMRVLEVRGHNQQKG